MRREADKVFSCPIIKVGSGKPRTLYHQLCKSPFKVLVPIKPSLYCLETFSILITVDIVKVEVGVEVGVEVEVEVEVEG